MQHKYVTGWDIGGAHLKIAQASNKNTLQQVMQAPCPVWKGLSELKNLIDVVRSEINITDSLHAITMTAELVDYFESRKQGVHCILEYMKKELAGNRYYVYAGQDGFLNTEITEKMYQQVASANWYASAEYIATRFENSLFVDVGSTTSDIVAIKDAMIINSATTDADRLFHGELVYSGAVRTPVFALCKSAPVNERLSPVINEYFANAADIYRLTNELPDYADLGETPDGREKSKIMSAARLARMFGYDCDSEGITQWVQIAKYIKEQQLQLLINACRKNLFKKTLPTDAPFIGAGVGRFLVQEIAKRFNRKYIDFSDLIYIDDVKQAHKIGDCAPASAIACLAYNKFIM